MKPLRLSRIASRTQRWFASVFKRRVVLGGVVLLAVVGCGVVSVVVGIVQANKEAPRWQLVLNEPLKFRYGTVTAGSVIVMGPRALMNFQVDRGFGTQELGLTGLWTPQPKSYQFAMDNCVTDQPLLELPKQGLGQRWWPGPEPGFDCPRCLIELRARLGDLVAVNQTAEEHNAQWLRFIPQVK